MTEVSLNHEAESLHMGEALRLDELSANIKLREFKLRENVASEILLIFKRANTVTFCLVIFFAIVDFACLAFAVVGYERLITSEVIMTLIGATVVQAGAAAFAIAVSLFPKTKDD
jgi:hypothetical protein